MPQLMPFMWVSSVFISLLLLLVLVIVYNYMKDFFLKGMYKEENNYFMKW